MTKYSPFVQYVIYQSTPVQPYAGVFYRHTAVDGQSGFNSAGGRAGINIISGRNAYFSVGLVREVYRDCQATAISTCRETYSELGLTFGF